MPVTPDQVAATIPQWWAAQAIGRLRKRTVLTRLVRRDVDNRIASLGDTVKIPKRGAVTVRTKTPGVPITSDAPDTTSVDVKLDKHKYVSIAVEDVTKAKAVQDGLNYLDDFVIALAEEIESDLQATYVDATTEVGVAGTDISDATIRNANEALHNSLAPTTGRFFLLSPKDEKNLLSLDLFVTANKRGDEGEALREANVGRAFGFDFFMSQLVPTTSGPTTYHSLSGVPNAIAIVSRPLPLPRAGSGVLSSVITDPVTGIAMRVTMGHSIKDQADIVTLDLLYGVKMVDERLAIEVLS